MKENAGNGSGSGSGSAQGLLTDPDFLKLKNFIISVTGLSYYQSKDEDLAGRIARRMVATSWTNCQGYLIRLGASTALGSELDLLIGELTIGETYFFRHSEQFEALRQLIIPDILKRNEGKKSISIWCAGCSTGAEPYSLSILLRREFKLQMQGWTIDILGTDINRNFLGRAAQGDFDGWHLRSMSEELKSACFKKTDKTWQINPEYKQGMSFAHHNLITGYYPPRPEGPAKFDIILCRNVMIYFSHETIASIMPQFDRCLNPSAWMLLGYSEINTELYKAFDLIPFPGAILFQKRLATEANIFAQTFPLPSLSPVVLPFPSLMSLAPPAPLPFLPIKTILESVAPTLPSIAVDPDAYHHCRKLSDVGDFKASLEAANSILKREQLDAKAHFLKALALVQLKDTTGAEEAFRKAIYIDRMFALAHYHLGLLYKNSEPYDFTKARRYFQNARAILEALPPASALTEGNGMNAKDLLQLLNSMGDAA